jgi:hypothetical protein
LCAARLSSAVAFFWWKIASSRRGALARTRWAHFNCNDEKRSKISLKNIIPRRRLSVNFSRRRATYNFFVPTLGSMGSIRDGGHE